MNAFRRSVFALAVALSLALPGVGGEGDGGENGGSTGVWVLPRAGFLTQSLGAPRASMTANPAADVVLQMSNDVGSCAAQWTDSLSQEPTGLVVSGFTVRVPAAAMQGLVAGCGTVATIMIADAAQLGYVIQVAANVDGSVTLRVH